MSGQFCGKCGISTGEDDAFCHRCGAQLGAGDAFSAEYAAVLRKTCPRCGESVPSGDMFCGGCGAGLAFCGSSQRGQAPKRAVLTGVTAHRRKRTFIFRLGAAVLFWGFLAGGCFTAFRHLGRGIPWPDVAAVISGSVSGGGTAPGPRDGAGPASWDLPPVSPEAPDSGDAAAPPEVPARPEWGESDADGYSALAAGGAPAEGLFLNGTVKGDRVRLRAGPNLKSNVLGHFDSGRELSVTRRYSSKREKYPWYMVVSGDVTGWMYGEFLRMEED